MFSIRIVTTSHYQAVPIPGLDVTYSDFRDGKVSKAPVLRIFGSTPAGQKTCMHIHGVFPYLYVPYDGTLPVDRYLRQFSASLDKAINIGNRLPSSNLQHVFKISVVSGIPMYGYHSTEEQFLKIYLYNPSNIRKAADLLLGGAVMNKPFQPHESHVPYPLQLFMDYNLYGMNLISVGALKFRRDSNTNEVKGNIDDADDSSSSPSSSFLSAPTQIHSVASSSSSLFSSNHVFSKDDVPSEFWHPDNVEKQSTCELEVDVIAADIINKQDLMNNVGANPGLAALWEDEKQRRREAGLSSQVITEDTQEREGIDLSESEKEMLERFADIVKQQQDLRDTQSTNEADESQSSIAASQVESHLSRQDSITSSQNTVILGDGEEDDERIEDPDRAPIVSLDSINKVVASSQSFHTAESDKSFTESQDLTVAGILAAILEEDAAGPSTSQQAATLADQDSILNATVLLNEDDLEKDDNETLVMSQAVIVDTGQHDKEPPDLEDSVSGSESPDIVMKTDNEESDDEDYDDENDVDLLPLPQFDGASDKIASHPSMQQQSSLSDNSSASDVNYTTNQQQSSQYSSENFQQRGRLAQPNYTPQQQWPSQGDWQARSPSWGTQQQQHSYPSWQKQQQQQQGTPQPYSSPLQSQPTTPGAASPFHSPIHNPYASPSHHPHQHPGIQQSQYTGGAVADFQSSSPSSSSQSQQSFSRHHSSTFNSPQPQPEQPKNDSSPFHSTSYAYHSKSQHGYSQYPAGTVDSGDIYQSPTSNHPYKSPPTDQMYQQPPSSTATSHNQSYQTQQTPTDPMSSPPPLSNNSQYPLHHRSPHGAGPTGKGYPQHPLSGFNYRSPHGNQGFRTPPACQGYSPVYPQSPLYAQQLSYQSSPQGPRYSSPSHPQSWSGSPSGNPYNSGYFSPTHISSPHSGKSLSDTTVMNYPNVPCGNLDLATGQGKLGSLYPTESSAMKVGKKLSKEEQKYNKKLSDAKRGSVPTAQNPGYARAVAPMKSALPESGSMLGLQERDNETAPVQLDPVTGTLSSTASELQQQPIHCSDQKFNADKERPMHPSSSMAYNSFPTTREECKTTQDPCTTPMIQQLLMEESPAKVNITPPTVMEDKNDAVKKTGLSSGMITPTTATISPIPSPTKGKKKPSKSKVAKLGMRQRSASLTSSPPNLPGHVINPMLRQQGMSNIPSRGRPMSHRFPHHSMQPFSPMGYGPYPSKNTESSNSTMQQHYSPVNTWQQQHQQWAGEHWQKQEIKSEIHHTSDSNDNGHPGPRLQQRSYSADCRPLSNMYSSPINPSSLKGEQHASPQASVCSTAPNQVSVNETQGFSDSFTTAQEKDGTLSSLLGLMSEDGLWGYDGATSGLVTGTEQQQGNVSGQQLFSMASSNLSGHVKEKSPDTKEFITLEPAGRSSLSSFDASGMTSSEESDRMDYEIAAGLMLSKTPGASSTPMGVSSHPPKVGKHNKPKTVDMLCRDIVHSGDGTANSSNNPAYTYTFHVPTRVFKRLKFYRSAQARKKHGLKVLRMHPMDARKYSLLKIGKEVVNMVRLSETDLAKYNVTLPPNLSPSDGSFSRVNLDIPLATSSRSSGSGYGSDDGHSSMSSYDTDFPPNKVAPPSSLPSGPALSPRSMSLRPTPTTPPSAPSSTSMNNEAQWPGQHYPMPSSITQQQAGYISGSSSTTTSSSNGNNFYSNPVMPFRGNHDPGMMSCGPLHPNHLRMNQYRPMPGVGQSPDQYNFYQNRNGSYRSNSMMPVCNGGQASTNTMASTSFPNSAQYNMNSGHQQSYYNYNNPSGLYNVYNQHQPTSHDRMRVENGMHNSNAYPTTSAPIAPNQKNGLRSPGQHGPITHTIDTDMLSDASGGDDDLTTSNSATTTTNAACLVNTRVTAQFGRVHAQNNDKTLPSSTKAKVDEDGASISKFSMTDTAARFNRFCESDQSNFSEPTLPQSQVSDKVNAGKIKHRKSRRKRDRRLSLRKALSDCCEDKDENVKMKSGIPNNQESKMSALCSQNSKLTGTRGKNCGGESDTKAERKQSSNIVVKMKTDSYLSDDTYLGNKKKNKNWKSLRLKIPIRNFSPVVNQWSGSMVSSEGVPEKIDENDIEIEGVPSEIQEHESKRVCSDEAQLGTRQSMRQAKLRSVQQNETSDIDKKGRKKKHCRKEGIHYIIVNKFRGHKKMLVKIPRIPVSVGEQVDANRFIHLSQRDVVRDCVAAVPDNNTDLHVINDNHPVQISVQIDNELSPQEEELIGKNGNGDTNSNFLQVNPPDSAATSPETPFFCRLKKTFIKRQGGKGWINVSQRTKRKNNVFFPGVLQRLFVRFQATFHDNVAKQEDIQDYSSSSDDEDDYLDDIILRGKIHHAKELGIKKDLIMERLNQSETFSLAEIPSKIPSTEENFDHNDKNSVDVIPEAYSNQNSNVEAFNFSPITPADNFSNEEFNTKLKWPGTGISGGTTHQNSNATRYLEDTDRFDSLMLRKDDNCLHVHTPNVTIADTVTKQPMPTLLSTKESAEDRNEFIKRQMAFYEDISSDPDSDDTIIDCDKSTAVPIVQPVPTDNSDNLCGLKGEANVPNQSEIEGGISESKVKDGISNKTEDGISNVKPINGHESESDTVTDCNTAINALENDKDDAYSHEKDNKPSNEVLELDTTDKAKTNNQEICLEKTDIGQEEAELCYEESPCEIVKLNICDLEARASQENTQVSNVTYNDLMSLKIETKKGKKNSNTKEKLQCKKPDSNSNSGNGRRKKRKETDLLSGMGTSSYDERDVSPIPSTNKRLRQRKQTKYTYHMDGIDFSSSSDDNDMHDFDVQRKSKTFKTKSATGSQAPAKKLNERLPKGRRKKGASNNKLFNSLSLLHMATLANLTESQDSPASPNGQDQAGSVANTISPYSDRANSDHNRDYASSLDTMSFVTPPDEPDMETSPPTALSPAQMKDKKKETKTSAAPCRILNFSNCPMNRIKPGCNGSSNIGTRPYLMNHLGATNSASSSPLPASFCQPVAEPSDQQGNSNTSNPKSDLDKVSGTIPFSMKQILRMSMTDDSMDSDSKDGPALIKPRDSKRAKVKSTALSMSDIMKMTSTANCVEDEENIEVCHTIFSGSNKELNLSSGYVAEVKDVALSFKDIIKINKEQEETKESDEESISSIPKPLSTDQMKDQEMKSKDDDIKNSSFDLIENSFIKSTSSSSDISLNDESNCTSKSDLLSDIPKESVDVISESILDDEQSTSKPILEPNTDDCKKEGLMKMKDGSLFKCLSPLSCIIEESQISRMSQDEFTSGEPDNGGTPAEVNSNINFKSSPTPSSFSGQTGFDKDKENQTIHVTGNNLSPDVVESSQETVRQRLAVSSITNTLVESESVKHDLALSNTDITPIAKTSEQKDTSPIQALKIPSTHQVPPHMMSPSSLSSKSLSGPSPHHSYPWCWKWQEHPQRVKELQNCPLNLSTSNIKSTTAVYSPITPTSPISACPTFPAVTSSANSTKDNTDSKSSQPPAKKAKALWYPWLSPKETSSTVNTLPSPSAQDSFVKASVSSEESRTDGSGKIQKTEFTKVRDIKPQKNLRISECSSISQFVGSVIETAYDMGQRTGAEMKKKCQEKPASASDMSFAKHLTQSTDNEKLERKHEKSGVYKDVRSSLDRLPFKNCQQTSTWYDPNQYFGQQTHFSSSSFTGHNSSKSVTPTVQSRKKDDDERVRNMLENERVLRGQFGLDTNLPISNGKQNKSSSVPPSNHMSLTDMLVTQLIKGDSAYQSKEAAASKKRGQKNREANSKEKKGADNSCSSGRRKDEDKGDDVAGVKRGKGDGREGSGDHSTPVIPSTPNNDQLIVICPEKRAPRRLSVENSLMKYGLNSVQVPSAFCSSVQDLPEKALDAGGRVLVVPSKRLSELKEFESASFLEGMQSIRAKSLASSSLLSSQASSTGEQMLQQQGHEIRFMFGPDKPMVLAPCQPPPKRKAVAQWLQVKLLEVMKGKENVQVGGIKNKNEKNEKMKAKRKSVTFTQLPTGRDSDDSSSPSSPLHNSDDDSDLDMSMSLSHTPSTSIQITPQESRGHSKIHLRKRKLLEESASGTSSSENKSSTPARRPSGDLFESASTPTGPSSRQSEIDEPRACEELQQGDNMSTQLLKRISTNTESALRRNVLLAQPQRQFSEMGFTAAEVSQIEGPTPNNSFGFKVPMDNMQDTKTVHKYQCVTAMSLELHAETRGELNPNPEHDAINAIFYSIFDDVPPARVGRIRKMTGVIIVDMDSWHVITERTKKDSPSQPSSSSSNLSQTASKSDQPSTSSNLDHDSQKAQVTPQNRKVSASPSRQSSPSPSTSKGRRSRSVNPSPSKSPKGKGKNRKATAAASAPKRPNDGAKALLERCAVDSDLEIMYVQDETDLMLTLVDLMHRFDPDILVGFEIQMLSWGYLLQRAARLNIALCSKISRIPDAKENNFCSADKDQWGADHMSEIHIVGRIVLNLWRILRHEVSLNTYTFENCAYHILHNRIPLFSFKDLTKYFNKDKQRWRVIDHYVKRVESQLKMIDQLDLIGKTSEFARVFGIEFYDVLSRGSQLRVESMMLRLAKPMNYVAVSPNVNQRARQRAPECIPLTLEPESKYYTSPVVVLDFQSLYPSIMIAYNYCFSTCLGRLDFLNRSNDGPIEFGCTSLPVSAKLLKKLKSKITISPNGVAFVKSSVRKGIISRMVEEILNTRIMVKKSMKDCKNDKSLLRMLDARQLGLKLIANVTYGYTGASFSGRMPCVEVADSIVRKARESLERAIKLVEDTPRWGARVVYGDTDSMFIHFPGRSKDEAFKLGHEIADAVTEMFPQPMKLKFEKVYLPCALESKKRYVGFMYETPDQKEPVFDAKGIETVRRDSCSAVSKILERSIKIFFSTHDLSRVRSYVCRQLHKVLEGRVSLLDLVFAKEFRGLMGYKPGACIPSLEIARKRTKSDPCSEPRVGERVPYVIVHGSPGLPLIQLVKEPQELIKDRSLRLNAVYYITKQILPPLDRLFSLVGVNVFKWYREMPKVVRIGHMMGIDVATKQGTISQFFATSNCPVCDAQTKTSICGECKKDPQLVVTTLNTKIGEWEHTYRRLAQVCTKCQGTQDEDQPCVSVDCPMLFRRHIARQDLHRAHTYSHVLNKYLEF